MAFRTAERVGTRRLYRAGVLVSAASGAFRLGRQQRDERLAATAQAGRANDNRLSDIDAKGRIDHRFAGVRLRLPEAVQLVLQRGDAPGHNRELILGPLQRCGLLGSRFHLLGEHGRLHGEVELFALQVEHFLTDLCAPASLLQYGE